MAQVTILVQARGQEGSLLVEGPADFDSEEWSEFSKKLVKGILEALKPSKYPTVNVTVSASGQLSCYDLSLGGSNEPPFDANVIMDVVGKAFIKAGGRYLRAKQPQPAARLR
ncbi:hypothetical protein KBB17_03510 [Candidatus Saccharibacteria bacterium]|nr:hypothetical protein [Candidatus Saccharibacteria bacterium]MBP9132002.1 hypothetical protein [Candidatus Saccharibacteria bacterium]